MAAGVESMIFLPFKTQASNSKVKITRRKLELDMSMGDFYPGEGHRALFKYDNSDSSCKVTVIGGSRRDEASYSLSNKIMEIKLISTSDDVYIESMGSLKTSGASLPALSSPGFSWGLNNTEMCIWGGLLLDSYQANDDLYYIKPRIYRKSTVFDVILYSGSSDLNFDDFDHVSVKNEILLQRATPKARAGHSLNNIPNSSKLVLFGGYCLPNREIQSSAFANPFVQKCEDDTFYILDLPSVTWHWLELPGPGARCFHSADFINEKQLAIVGGLRYEGNKPSERHPRNSVTVLNIIDISTMEFSLSNYTFDLEPTYLSYHGSVVFNHNLLVYGGYIQRDPQMSISSSSTPKLSHEMFIFDFHTLRVTKVSSPKEYAVAGNSMVVADETTVLIIGGSIRNYFVFTSKPFTPSPCDLNINCTIQDCPKLSPIQWIQCDGVCHEWHHLFCTGLKGVPRGKYYCKSCSTQKTKKPKKQK